MMGRYSFISSSLNQGELAGYGVKLFSGPVSLPGGEVQATQFLPDSSGRIVVKCRPAELSPAKTRRHRGFVGRSGRGRSRLICMPDPETNGEISPWLPWRPGR